MNSTQMIILIYLLTQVSHSFMHQTRTFILNKHRLVDQYSFVWNGFGQTHGFTVSFPMSSDGLVIPAYGMLTTKQNVGMLLNNRSYS